MVVSLRQAERPALRLLAAADAVLNRLYGWRFNPLYQSGSIVVALFGVLVVTGLWLIVFYRVGSPWESVDRLTNNPWVGNWVRGLHRYASDLAVVATAVHAFRMFAEGRSWGARALAWVSGAVLLLLVFICGWTGYVLVWDTFGQHLAREGARMIDALPLLSEPTARAFTGEQPLPSAFFFLNLFAHIGIPLLMGVAFWIHIKRVARPVLLPPRPLLWTIVGALTAVAIAWPLEMAPKADPFVLPRGVPADWFFVFWLPLASHVDGGSALLLATLVGLALVVVPVFTARRGPAAPPHSVVDEDLCVGCVQCALDCPYEAITMVARAGPRIEPVARVDPALCVSCGICAGSCPPMGIGPPGRSGRDQLTRVREFAASPGRRTGEIVAICCEAGPGHFADELAAGGVAVFPASCAGNLHTSTIEMLLRAGAGGVLVLTCPPRDCEHREGPRWTHERVFLGREAELQDRVDRARVRIAHANARERAIALSALREFAAHIAGLERPAIDEADVDEVACEPGPVPRRRRA
jgi:ferredoxin/coenzyme F420-reducing hydrogenase delta subunit